MSWQFNEEQLLVSASERLGYHFELNDFFQSDDNEGFLRACM